MVGSPTRKAFLFSRLQPVSERELVVKIARIICCLCAVTWVLASATAMGQRVQFPSMVQAADPAPGGPSGTSPAFSPYPSSAPAATPYPAPSPAPYPGPYAAPTPGAPFDPAAGGQPPIAAFNGTIQTPPPNWVRYATPPPGSSAILPQGPYIDWGHPMATVAKMQRFIQAVRVDYHYFAPEGSNPLGFNEIELNTTLAIPFSCAMCKRRC